VPALEEVTPTIDGVATVDVNPAGPLQEYVIVPVAVAEALKFTVPPAHAALVFVGVVTGTGLTVTVVVLRTPQPVREDVAVNVYTPAAEAEIPLMPGLVTVEVYPAGPAHR